MVTSEFTGEVSMGVLLVFLVFWRWGRYIGPDQQGDTTVWPCLPLNILSLRRIHSKSKEGFGRYPTRIRMPSCHPSLLYILFLFQEVVAPHSIVPRRRKQSYWWQFSRTMSNSLLSKGARMVMLLWIFIHDIFFLILKNLIATALYLRPSLDTILPFFRMVIKYG
jgi:hypothetical protein